MDSRIVNKQIRAEIRPLLKQAGFTQFTARNFWRYAEPRIEVVNFQSFNAYHASVMGCTTYSFSVNLGCFYTNIPSQHGRDFIKRKGDALRPEEYDCQFRRQLRRSIPQAEYESPDVWYIDPDGRYLEKAVHDVRVAILRDALPWFERLADPWEALRTLQEDDEAMDQLWGVGRNPSPIRHYLTGYFALNVGDAGTAKRHLREALESGCFEEARGRLEADVAELELAPDGPLSRPAGEVGVRRI